MKFDILKTRRGRLKRSLETELEQRLTPADLEKALKIFDVYEGDNLATIEKLKKEKSLEIKKINGALKQAINSHGPITKVLIGSAAKRIYGALLDNKIKTPLIIKIRKWIGL